MCGTAAGSREEPHDRRRSARAGTRFLEAQNSFFRIGNDDVDAKTVEDPGQCSRIEMDIERRVENAVHETRKVAAGAVDAVLAKNRNPRIGFQTAKKAGQIS